jgi:hypothetical protein
MYFGSHKTNVIKMAVFVPQEIVLIANVKGQNSVCY